MPFLNQKNFKSIRDLVEFPYFVYLDHATRLMRRRLLLDRLLSKGNCVTTKRFGPEYWTTGRTPGKDYGKEGNPYVKMAKAYCATCPVVKECRFYLDDVQVDTDTVSFRSVIMGGSYTRPEWERRYERKKKNV